MLCNKCGHHVDYHSKREGRCIINSCPCRSFVKPGDADAYEGSGQVSTADSLTLVTWYNVATKLHEQLAVANEAIAAASKLADACRNSGDESVQAALAEYRKVTT